MTLKLNLLAWHGFILAGLAISGCGASSAPKSTADGLKAAGIWPVAYNEFLNDPAVEDPILIGRSHVGFKITRYGLPGRILWNGRPAVIDKKGYDQHWDRLLNSITTNGELENGAVTFATSIAFEPSGRCILQCVQIARRPGRMQLEILGKERRLIDFKSHSDLKIVLNDQPLPRFDKKRGHLIDREIQIDGPEEDQIRIKRLLAQVIGPGARTGGASFHPATNRYGGRMFWDADVWILPSLLWLDPVGAQEIIQLRIGQQDGARQNFRDWLASGKPTGFREARTAPKLAKGSVGEGLKYAWETDKSGRELTGTPSYFQEHVSASVCLGLDWAAAAGLADPAKVDRIRSGVAGYYRQRISKRVDGKFTLNGVMSPDENWIGDGDLYTNLAVQRLLPDLEFHTPRDQTTFLAYDKDPLRGYKQEAALLSVFPLQNPAAEKEALAMLDRFPPLVSRNGPSMSGSIHALVEARFGSQDKALGTWRKAMDGPMSPALGTFHEKSVNSEPGFVTGAAGGLNSVIYGFAGLRLDENEPKTAAWKMKMKRGWWLSLSPRLPGQWKSLTFNRLEILGDAYRIRIQGRRVEVEKTSRSPAK